MFHVKHSIFYVHEYLKRNIRQKMTVHDTRVEKGSFHATASPSKFCLALTQTIWYKLFSDPSPEMADNTLYRSCQTKLFL